MSQSRTLIEAEFNPKVRSYWLLSGTFVLVATIIGIVLLPIWWIIGQWATQRYLDRMTCTLTERSLKVTRGILVRREMTVPLDKITDVGLVEGPIMRYLDLQAVRIETAGQSTAGAAVQLVGVRQARDFRDAVLTQRDLVSDRGSSGSGSAGSGSAAEPSTPALGHDDTTVAVLSEIRDTLRRIEDRLPASPEE
ncbi:MAG TPA: PH domain-containing protein [Longimicrobiales bacterium]|nr:PH domain-containing protein [Longimicrobiales bacterium]